MGYEKVPDTEMHTFNPIASHQPPLRPFDDRDNEKDKINKGKEKRISVSIIILSFLASVCVLFGTLYPELDRAEIDMVRWRSLIQASVQRQGWLIRDKITVVNLGLWRYCYDDQLYDLIEVINPQFGNLGRRRRSVEEEHTVEKRQVEREGALDIRCHNLPNPWKMPYDLRNKLLATKITLITGISACILCFLISILVLITRLPFLKLLQLLSSLLGAISVGVAIGLVLSAGEDIHEYFNDAMGRSLVLILREDFDLDLQAMGIDMKKAGLVTLIPGVSFIFIIAACFVMLVAAIFSELIRHLS